MIFSMVSAWFLLEMRGLYFFAEIKFESAAYPNK